MGRSSIPRRLPLITQAGLSIDLLLNRAQLVGEFGVGAGREHDLDHGNARRR